MSYIGPRVLCLLLVFSGQYATDNYDHEELTRWPFSLGGHSIPIEQAPYMAVVEANGVTHCVGSIIGPNVVLTAAHCLGSRWLPRLTVRVGVEEIHEKVCTGGPVHHAIELHLHEQFVYKQPYEHDLAMIWVRPAFSLSDKVRPIKMGRRDPMPNTLAVFTGYVNNSEKSGVWERLARVELVVLDVEDCRKQSAWLAPATQICTWCPKKEQAAYKGDSGGPLVVQGRLVGVLCCGMADFQPMKGSRHSSIAAHRRWISYKLLLSRYTIWKSS